MIPDKHKPLDELLLGYGERAFWTAVQAFFAVVIVDGGFSWAALGTAAVAAGLAVVNNVILPLAAKRLKKLDAEQA